MGERLAETGGDLFTACLRIRKMDQALEEFQRILFSASAGRDLHCGFYVAKEYHFTTKELDRLKKLVAEARRP